MSPSEARGKQKVQSKKVRFEALTVFVCSGPITLCISFLRVGKLEVFGQARLTDLSKALERAVCFSQFQFFSGLRDNIFPTHMQYACKRLHRKCSVCAALCQSLKSMMDCLFFVILGERCHLLERHG
jgi:hypothetical protein